MGRFRVLPYKQGSASAKALAEALGGKVLKLIGSKFVPKEEDIIINWGNTVFNESAEWGPNTPDAFFNYDTDLMRSASNKLLFFENMKENAPDIIPKFWQTKEEIPNEEYPVVCRTVLAGHSGAGIIIADVPADAVACKLYVKYEKKKDEYRVHCAKNTTDGTIRVVSIQRKAKRNGAENVNWKVRNLANGFIYKRSDVHPPARVLEVARKALELSGLDFGAVDVIWNNQKEKAYVLEINTAPGLEGQTIQDYANFFKTACTETDEANP